MNRKKLTWNKQNIEIAQQEAERMMLDNRTLYGILRAMLWAIGFILDQMEREKE